MTQLRLASQTFAASAVLLLASLAPRLAFAQSTCAANSDCDQGFECTVVGGSACGSSGAAPAPTCPPGQTCEPAPMMPIDECEPMEIKACMPAHCTSDAQCAAGMVCHAWPAPCASSDCACSSDMPDCDCGPEPMCDPNASVSMCTPTYVLPCQQAADCGEGFTCEQLEQPCACGGAEARPVPMEGAGAADPGAPGFAPPQGAGGQPSDYPLPNPEPCSCEPTTVFACVPREIECADASACPSGWVCEQDVEDVPPSCAGEGCPKAAPLPPARGLCRPEYYGGVDGGVSLPGLPASDPGPMPGGNTGASNPESDNSKGDTDGAESHESAACQMGRAPASSGALSILAVLGALLGLRRRKV